MRDPELIPFGRPWITAGDRLAVARVLDGHILTHGPRCRDFEEEFATFAGGDSRAVTVSSCMAALHLAWLHLGVGPGDEVVVPAQTHVATVHAVELTGAKPVFADCDSVTGNVTAESIRSVITPQTKGIGVVHFAGIPCDMPEIMEVAEEFDLKVVEDCALALGARWDGRHVGLFGDAGCFSFYPIKHITTGEGGMFLTRYPELAAEVAQRRAFGVDRGRGKGWSPGLYDVTMPGLNYRMSELQAALGRSQLSRLVENLERRGANFQALSSGLSKHPSVRILDAVAPEAASSHYCLVLVLEGVLGDRRAELMDRLKSAGVETSIYYPHPVPRFSFYREKYACPARGYATAASISDQSVALPVGPHLNERDVIRMVSVLDHVLAELGAGAAT